MISKVGIGEVEWRSFNEENMKLAQHSIPTLANLNATPVNILRFS
jgi:hypothetical protein